MAEIMTSTIELLETIGRDASLRHASGSALEQTLDDMGASEGLKSAAISGESERLNKELGPKPHEAIQVNHNPHDGGCDIAEDDDLDEGLPSQDGDDAAREIKPEF